MEIIMEAFNGFNSIYGGLSAILGFDPFLILTVFLVVAAGKGLIGNRFDKYRKQILTFLCFAASFGVLYVTNHAPDEKFIKNSIVLGSIATFTYNIFKGLLQWAADKLVQKLEASTGKDYQDPELPL